jgi:tetratricopeptide (TPR) repeat protein
VAWEAIKEKPVLGWGLENFSVGFDKHYDPSLPYISKAWGGWWDRAHNIIFETGATAGIPAVVAYLALFAVLLWQLQKIKNANKNPGDESDRILNISVHAIQATFIAYLAANFFSFDTSSSYIVFFMIVGYSLYLINENILKNSGQQQESLPNNFLNKTGQKIVAFRKPVIVVLSFLLLYFLWQYNLKPYQISVQLNIVDNLTEAGQCPEAFARLEKVLPKKSFLEAYTGLEYVKTIKKCAELHPENDLEYAKKGAEVLKTSVISRPLYTRSWIYLGGFATIMASKETDQTKKENLLSEARSYMEKASALAPKHQEIIIEAAKTELVAENYKAMKEKTNECIALDPGLGECYWYLSLAELYLKDFENAKNNAKKAYENGFNISSNSSLFQLANVYVRLENYEGLALVYEQLVLQNPSVAQYHSSLAFIYREMGYYKRSRLEALKFLEMMPEAKEEVDAFLKTLPE